MSLPDDPTPALLSRLNQNISALKCAIEEMGTWIDKQGSRVVSGWLLAEVPAPEVGAHDVLVQVHATSVNVLNSKISTGEFKLIFPYSFPLILGNDLARVVVSVGFGVRRFKPGDEVYARPPQERISTQRP